MDPRCAFGPVAEPIAKYLEKGSFVAVEGALRTNEYEKNGETRYSTEVRASRVGFLDRKPAGETAGAETSDEQTS
jgi:single-strand DNA-binding protein